MGAPERRGRTEIERETAPMDINPAWTAIGILAVLAMVVGSTLLVVYAIRRGLVHRDLDGTIAAEGQEGTMPAPAGSGAKPSRAMGTAGVIILVVGLGLGMVAVLAGGPGTLPGFGPGNPPKDCAGAWGGCPQATANPLPSSNP
jgi:hypothetical protein